MVLAIMGLDLVYDVLRSSTHHYVTKEGYEPPNQQWMSLLTIQYIIQSPMLRGCPKSDILHEI